MGHRTAQSRARSQGARCRVVCHGARQRGKRAPPEEHAHAQQSSALGRAADDLQGGGANVERRGKETRPLLIFSYEEGSRYGGDGVVSPSSGNAQSKSAVRGKMKFSAHDLQAVQWRKHQGGSLHGHKEEYKRIAGEIGKRDHLQLQV